MGAQDLGFQGEKNTKYVLKNKPQKCIWLDIPYIYHSKATMSFLDVVLAVHIPSFEFYLPWTSFDHHSGCL